MIRTSTWLFRKRKFQHFPPQKEIRFKERCLGIICGRDCCTEQRMRHQPGRSTVATKRFKKKLGGSPRLVDLKGHGRIDVQPWLQDPSDTSGRILDHEAKTCAKIYYENLSFLKKNDKYIPSGKLTNRHQKSLCFSVIFIPSKYGTFHRNFASADPSAAVGAHSSPDVLEPYRRIHHGWNMTW